MLPSMRRMKAGLPLKPSPEVPRHRDPLRRWLLSIRVKLAAKGRPQGTQVWRWQGRIEKCGWALGGLVSGGGGEGCCNGGVEMEG